MKMSKEEEFIMALQTKVEASRRSKLGLKEEVVKKGSGRKHRAHHYTQEGGVGGDHCLKSTL